MTIQAPQATRPPFDPVSISPLSFWDQTAEEREKSFKILRDERPVSWHPPIEGAVVPADIDGVWAVTRNEDISYVSKHPEPFCSSEGVLIEAIPEDVNQAAMSFLAMDGAQHSSTRRLISSVFTPRQVAKISDQIEGQAVRIVDDLLSTKDGDFVERASRLLPMWTIFEMVGVPDDLRVLDRRRRGRRARARRSHDRLAGGVVDNRSGFGRAASCTTDIGSDQPIGASRGRRATAHR
jgi:cytochrome P450